MTIQPCGACRSFPKTPPRQGYVRCEATGSFTRPKAHRMTCQAFSLIRTHKPYRKRGEPAPPLPDPAPCECGCGDLASPGKRFILGHHMRKRANA